MRLFNLSFCCWIQREKDRERGELTAPERVLNAFYIATASVFNRDFLQISLQIYG